MDPLFNGLSDPINGFILNQETIFPTSEKYPNETIFPTSEKYPNLTNETIFPTSDQYPNLKNDFKFENDSLDLSFFDLPSLPSDQNPGSSTAPSWSESQEGGGTSSSSDENEDPVLKYISQMLLEEDMETKPCMLRDSLALHAAEKSFYDVLGEKYPPNSPNQHPLYQIPDSPDDNFDFSASSNQFIDLGEYNSSVQETPFPVLNNNFLSHSTKSPFNSSNSFSNNVTGGLPDNEWILQFKRGVEEASKFLPSNNNNNLLIDLESYKSALDQRAVGSDVIVKASKGERENSPNGGRGRKREDIDLEDNGRRSNKQFAVSVEDEDELSEMFDKILLCNEGKEAEPSSGNGSEILHNGERNSHAKKQGNKKETVDLRSLLILCAQSVSADDRRTANELLKQIRQHSSPSGDGTQRLAHCFADGLEARLNGTGALLYSALPSKKTSAADLLKAFQVYVQACPFMKISLYYANQLIFNAAENSKTLHIIDFGICYGFQWPILIQSLSSRPGGPPKLRITGIDFPQSGFRPAAGVEETGRRLVKYCERFNVPFEYNAIAKKWDTIQIEDLKIERENNEVVAVNCMYRLQNLLDETVVKNCPRNYLLNLIRKINPDIFVHSVVNGHYNAPFFVTRFREALFHFSAFFDMFDVNVSRGDEERLTFEREFYGREVINVIACEGSERVERPETYKQWHVRSVKAGFKQLPLDQEFVKKYRDKLKKCCHKDFGIDEDGHWMLLGWKGRIVNAVSCWVPA